MTLLATTEMPLSMGAWDGYVKLKTMHDQTL